MIKKIVYLFLLYIVIISYSNIFILGSFPLTLNKESSNFFKNYIQKLMNFIYQNGFSKIYFSGKYVKTDKIDIVISNHTNSIDFTLNSLLYDYFDYRSINYLIKRNTSYIPAFGFICSSSTDILINRNIEDDRNIIINKIKKMKDSVIFIMPEGTRFTPEKQKKAIKYANENNLPVFKNTLFPKMKGLWLIIKILKSQNRLGNLIDFTVHIENIMGKAAYLPDLLNKDLGDTRVLINTYKIPTDDSLEDYNNFKNWFLNIWEKKDKNLDNMDNFNYKRLPVKISFIYLLSMVMLIGLFIFLNMNTKFKYLLISLFCCYFITFIRNIKETSKKNN